MLILSIKKKWFDMILSGEKKEEYREFNRYYASRFDKHFYVDGVLIPNYVIFRNGYKKDSPKIKCLCSLAQGFGKKEWGAEPDTVYYILEILSVENVEVENENK